MKEAEKSNHLRKLIYAGISLALCILLPLLTGNIPLIGKALCPMHIPVLICGFICGPIYGVVVGLIAPVLRFLLFSMPPIFPTGVAMCFELAAYGLMTGLLYKELPMRITSIYISLVGAMVLGRIIWGIARVLLSGVSQEAFTWAIFLSDAVINAIPGIILQILIIPPIILALQKSGVIKNAVTVKRTATGAHS